MNENTKYQSSAYLDEVERLKADLASAAIDGHKVKLDNYHPLTIQAAAPDKLRKKDRDYLKKNHGIKDI